MLEYIQNDFRGGMNLFEEDYALAANEYGLAYNVRCRTSALSTISAPVEDTSAPKGLKQGIYAFDNYIVLFNAGAAYYKNIVTDSAWVQISGFALSTTAETVYTAAVPTSKNNYARKLNSADRADGSSVETNVSIDPSRLITENPAGLVCQDGTSQPFLITADGNARQLYRYDEWKLTAREYVPVMKQMWYINGILFGALGKTIYRSVSGRPLDFVVNIDSQGNKGGDASTTSYNVSYNDITCLSGLNSGELLVGTSKSIHPIEFNYERTIFAEPTFLNRRELAVGVVNQFSFIDILGDYCFVDIDGIRSFNAVATLQNEGRNSVFSARIAKAFLNVKQTSSATIVFDNYSLYAVKTVYGNNLIAVYDNTRQIWVGFDNLGLGNPIKQFAIAKQSTQPTLWAITADKVYKLYSSPDELEATVNLQALNSGKPSSTIKLEYVYPVFDGGTTEDEVTITETVDNLPKGSWTRPISAAEDGSVDAVTFKVAGKQGWKISPKISWQNEAKLAMVEVKTNEATNTVANKQRANSYANNGNIG